MGTRERAIPVAAEAALREGARISRPRGEEYESFGPAFPETVANVVVGSIVLFNMSPCIVTRIAPPPEWSGYSPTKVEAVQINSLTWLDADTANERAYVIGSVRNITLRTRKKR